MLDWFNNSDPAVQAAVITSGTALITALIAGIVKLISKNKSQNSTIIKQKQKGNHNTQIGIQNNYGKDAYKND